MSQFFEQFKQTFLVDGRWRYFLKGTVTTLELAFMAVALGIVIGLALSLVQNTYNSNKRDGIINSYLLRIGNFICGLYLLLIRGTPTTVQLLLMWFVLFRSARDEHMLWIAGLTFGINSGAYVAEIIRSGIQSVDRGQSEAARSLGLSYMQSIRYVIMPQALRNILPALGNELITLLKETSVCGFIGLTDLTRGAMIVQSRTYSPTLPYLSIALMYLILVIAIVNLLKLLEKRFFSNDRY